MPADYPQCLENLTALIEKVGDSGQKHRNEATTRLQLIDELLFDCLGWDKADCVAEDNFDGTYTDYSLGNPHKNLIVEAKKEDIYFEVPAGLREITYRINRFRDEAPSVYEAIRQAMGYCQSRGVPFGVVCNGHQLIAFLASRTDGIPPIDGRALIFAPFSIWPTISYICGIVCRAQELRLEACPSFYRNRVKGHHPINCRTEFTIIRDIKCEIPSKRTSRYSAT